MNQERSGGFGQDPGYQNRRLPALALVTATAFAGYGTGNRTPALVRYKNESINRLVNLVSMKVTDIRISFEFTSKTSSVDFTDHIQYRRGAADVTKTYAIENSWTMKVEDTISAHQRLREENAYGHDWERDVAKGREEERTEELLESDYFVHLSIERERRLQIGRAHV